MTPAAQKACAAAAHAKGVVLFISAGGATESPFTTTTGTAYGNLVGTWAKQHYFDGVDFDIENLGVGFTGSGLASTSQQLVQWLVDASKVVKAMGLFVAHAPQAPYFGPIGGTPQHWTGATGGYSAVYKAAPNAIDFFLVQYYNQGPTCYTTYAGIFTKSASDCPVFPGTSVQEIVSYGIPMNKIVVGKYNPQSSASNGWVAPATLSGYFTQAKAMGWNAGVMCWQYSSTAAGWLAAIYPTLPAPKPIMVKDMEGEATTLASRLAATLGVPADAVSNVQFTQDAEAAAAADSGAGTGLFPELASFCVNNMPFDASSNAKTIGGNSSSSGGANTWTAVGAALSGAGILSLLASAYMLRRAHLERTGQTKSAFDHNAAIGSHVASPRATDDTLTSVISSPVPTVHRRLGQDAAIAMEQIPVSPVSPTADPALSPTSQPILPHNDDGSIAR